MSNTPIKYFGGYCPTAHEKSVVLGGGLTLYPISNPPEVAATLHLYSQRLWEAAYAQGEADTQKKLRTAMGIR
jgi:hypothetical protein